MKTHQSIIAIIQSFIYISVILHFAVVSYASMCQMVLLFEGRKRQSSKEWAEHCTEKEESESDIVFGVVGSLSEFRPCTFNLLTLLITHNNRFRWPSAAFLFLILFA